MRISKAWLIATRDFKVFRRQKNIWYSVVILPVIISVLFPLITYSVVTRKTGIPAAQLTGLLNTFSFFFVIGAAFVPLAIASYSIVGEKVEKSLEPLLATPLTDGEILLGKTISAVLPTLIALYTSAAVFMTAMDAATYGKLGYNYYPNWNIAPILLALVPIAVVLSVEYSIIVSSRVSDVRSANTFGALIVLPMAAIFYASETGFITLDTNTVIIIAGILLAVDVVLFFVSTAGFNREEILTKWK